MIKAKVIADSISSNKDRLTTLELTYPRYIHSELLTHRILSRNSSSSRAIPVKTMIEEVKKHPFFPIFRKNKRGMSTEEDVSKEVLSKAEKVWYLARQEAIGKAEELANLGVHKQIVNRILEPYSHITTIVSATDYSNFFNLRISEAAQDEIRELAIAMRNAITTHTPTELVRDDWHLPYILDHEVDKYSDKILRKLSVARCARVSYLNHDNSLPDVAKDIELHDRLFKDKHLSPFEHVAIPMLGRYGNFLGFKQYRQYLEEEE